MPTDLQKMTVAELDALIERAHEVRETTRERRRLDLKTEIETKLKGEGFTPLEVLGAKIRPKPEPLPAKYADPADASQTWSGKGRMPGWLQTRIDAGATLESFLIKP
jgi:DNA-binding protein H-NS